ncbi:MAG: T9SS type A sorting domain-containing protein, partial [Candidatus Zixiibacteriota bacterium]
LDNDGNDEIIFASGELLSVVTPDGKNFLREYIQCTTCPPPYEDTAIATVHTGRAAQVPLYVKLVDVITAGPVTGIFPDGPDTNKLVAVGINQTGGFSNVELYRLSDAIDNNGQADIAGGPGQGFFLATGVPIAMSFGDILYVLTDSGYVYKKDSFLSQVDNIFRVDALEYHGICRAGKGLVVMAGDALKTNLYYLNGTDTASIHLDEHYTLGPIIVDMNLDGIPEVAAVTKSGDIILVSVDLSTGGNPFSVIKQSTSGYTFTVNPIAGDVDLDGYPDIIIGGTNAIYAFNYELILKTSFPITINDRFPDDDVIAAPIISDIEKGNVPEIIFPTQVGNLYSLGTEISYGFPLSAGEIGAGSPVVVSDTTGGKLGYLGADGWFYLWEVDLDSITNFWPMGGADPGGSLNFDISKLPALKQYANLLPDEQFYNYPNPVIDGSTTIRYFLGSAAVSVTLTIYNLGGQEIAELNGPTTGKIDNELTWDCSNVTPGVYRCIINVDFNGNNETAFTDIAVIR